MDIYGNNFKYISETNNLEAKHFSYNTDTKMWNLRNISELIIQKMKK